MRGLFQGGSDLLHFSSAWARIWRGQVWPPKQVVAVVVVVWGGSGAYYAPLHLCSVLPGWGGSDLSSWALMIFSDDFG